MQVFDILNNSRLIEVSLLYTIRISFELIVTYLKEFGLYLISIRSSITIL
jgi:hypothetical protein